MRKIVPGALAGLVVAAALAAPSYAAAVDVRVEGDAQTLVHTQATPSGAAVGKGANPTCAGGSALDALDVATGGNWDGPYYDGLGYAPELIAGETHAFAQGSYWSFWINDAYSSSGLCDVQVQQGDELLFFPDCATTGCTPVSPLRLTGVPATARPGQTVTVKVEQLTAPVYPATETTAAPAAGATVTFGTASAASGADGAASVTAAGAGPQSVQATRPGTVRSAKEATCVTTGSDGACGSGVPGTPGAPATPAGKDTTAPTATISGLKKTYRRGRGPRELRGTVSADPSGIKSVRIAVTRRRHGRCSAFDGAAERFRAHRCGGWKSFRIGDRADWSYLLPKRLGAGRYTIRVVAIDKAGNDGTAKTRIRVR